MSQTIIVPPADEHPLTSFGGLLTFFGVLWASARVVFASGMDFDLDWDEFIIELSLEGFVTAVGLVLLCIGLRSITKGLAAFTVISGAIAGLLLIGVIGGTALAWVAG